MLVTSVSTHLEGKPNMFGLAPAGVRGMCSVQELGIRYSGLWIRQDSGFGRIRGIGDESRIPGWASDRMIRRTRLMDQPPLDRTFDLVERAKAGDPDALNQLFARFLPAL